LTAAHSKERPLTCSSGRCPPCHSEQIVKRGKTRRGTQRYLCQHTAWAAGSFLLDYCNRGCLPEVKQTIIDMSLNASGIRDTARVLHISPDPGLNELRRKEVALESVNRVCKKVGATQPLSTPPRRSASPDTTAGMFAEAHH
jgi:predicted RNA-binding Zn-ribbon protein involved in translation (DUF1610 family)